MPCLHGWSRCLEESSPFRLFPAMTLLWLLSNKSQWQASTPSIKCVLLWLYKLFLATGRAAFLTGFFSISFVEQRSPWRANSYVDCGRRRYPGLLFIRPDLRANLLCGFPQRSDPIVSPNGFMETKIYKQTVLKSIQLAPECYKMNDGSCLGQGQTPGAEEMKCHFC